MHPTEIGRPRATDFGVTTNAKLLDCMDLLSKEEKSSDLLNLGSVYVNCERMSENISLKPGDHVRVHCQPRRFPLTRLAPRVALETEDFWVFDKPPGLPMHATCDNRQENLLSFVESEFGMKAFLCHRLDIPTSGLVLVAKSALFQRQFQRLLEQRQVGKWYEAFTESAPPIGPLSHFMETGKKGTKRLSETAVPGWKACHLVVEESVATREGHRVKIRLLTGRHHQIRAQLSKVGSPIHGDLDYGSKVKGPLRLRCVGLSFLKHQVMLPHSVPTP